MKKPTTVEEYISGFGPEIRKRLKQLRALVKKRAPGSEEYIGYGMPAYRLEGPLVYFAGFGGHIGFYALPSGHSRFAKELARYKQGKGSVQFPHDEPLPLDLIGRMVEFRVAENLKKTGTGVSRRSGSKTNSAQTAKRTSRK